MTACICDGFDISCDIAGKECVQRKVPEVYEQIEKRKLSERLDKANHLDQEWFFDVMEDVLLNVSHMVRHPNAKRSTLRSTLVHLGPLDEPALT